MSIKKKTMYTVQCDGCGNLSGEEPTEFSAWEQPFAAIKEARKELGWIQDEASHYCPDCTTWNEDESELIPKED